MKFNWGFWRARKEEIPEEFRRITNVSMGEVLKSVYQDIQTIGSFIHVEKLQFGIMEFVVSPLQCSRRELEKLKRFTTNGVSVNRRVYQEDITRRMECSYELHYWSKEVRAAVVVKLSVYVQVQRQRKLNGEADAMLQDMCNLAALGYLKKVYPKLYPVFADNIEEPTIPKMKSEFEQKLFIMNQQKQFELSGLMLTAKNDYSYTNLNGTETVGELLGLKRKEGKKNEVYRINDCPGRRLQYT